MKRKRELKRDGLNRIMGSMYDTDFLHNDNEHYKDVKCKDIIFPKSDQEQPSPVTTYTLTPEELEAYLNK